MRHSHPIIAAIYNRMCASAERKFLADLRREVVGRAHGTVVEIGAGTGLNFPHYRADAIDHLFAVEPDPHMRRRADLQARAPALPLKLIEGTAERLPFQDDFADTIVATLVMCSVDDPQQAVMELARVLKDDGQLLFIEHVRSDEPQRARMQDVITPLWRRIAGNCHANRASVAALHTAGFAVEELRRVPGGPWGNPVVAGVART